MAAAAKTTSNNAFASRARRVYWETLAKRNSDARDAAAAWQFARACFDVADFATNNAERAGFAEQGIAACREVLAKAPDAVQAHYYLGMNLGQLAQTKGIGALKLVGQMEREFLLCLEEDEQFDYAGPDRNLGLLYRDAPSIGSIGSRSKAKQHLTRATEIAPGYPENRLNLAESFLKWNDHNGAVREIKALEQSWAAARDTFSGDDWAQSWLDWKKRLVAAKQKLETSGKAIQSPHHND